jgi:Zn-finger nucleic acid-binding protein
VSAYREAAGAPCPRCGAPLVVVKSTEGVWTCGECGGVWTDVERSARIVQRLDRTLLEIGFTAGQGKERKEHDATPLSCPGCEKPMHRTPIASAACVVDACAAHGTWFDAGELEDVIRALGKRKPGVMPPNAAPVTYEHDTTTYSPTAHFIGKILYGMLEGAAEETLRNR